MTVVRALIGFMNPIFQGITHHDIPHFLITPQPRGYPLSKMFFAHRVRIYRVTAAVSPLKDNPLPFMNEVQNHHIASLMKRLLMIQTIQIPLRLPRKRRPKSYARRDTSTQKRPINCSSRTRWTLFQNNFLAGDTLFINRYRKIVL